MKGKESRQQNKGRKVRKVEKVESKGEINTNKLDMKGPWKRDIDRQSKKFKQVAALCSNRTEGGCCHLLFPRVPCLLPLHAAPFPAAHFVPDAGCP